MECSTSLQRLRTKHFILITTPHIDKKDIWYRLLIAERDICERHRSIMARSWNVDGPYEGDPASPVLGTYLRQAFSQALGHSDIFTDQPGEY